MPPPRDLDDLLRDWPFQSRTISARLVSASDGREVVQMRVDLGVLQMETEGRPDGTRPGGAETYLDFLLQEAFSGGEPIRLSTAQCEEIDREFAQFYHRRICWLALREFSRAVRDADHTLELMDFLGQCRTDPDWRREHEQFRPLVLFHRTQAAALGHLEMSGPEMAIEEISRGIDRIAAAVRDDQSDEGPMEQELMNRQLGDLQDWIRDHYRVDRTLGEQLADAIAAEEYERAASLRDQIARRERKT